MEIKIDTHLHSTYSGHAWPNIYQIAETASFLGLDGVVLTDHSPKTPSSLVTDLSLAAFELLERTHAGVYIFRGLEANILDNGSLDVSHEERKHLDFLSFAYHSVVPCLPINVSKNTERALKSMEEHKARIFCHPLREGFIFDIDTVVKRAKELNVAIELNNNAILIEPETDWMALAKSCAKHECPVTIASDAHSLNKVGQVEEAIKLAQEAKIPPEIVVNRNLKTFNDWLKA